MKQQKWLAAALALSLALTLAVPSFAAEGSGYADVPAGAWYEEAVTYCRESGLLLGTGGDLFSPDLTVSRGTLAEVLYRLAGSPDAAGSAPFTDVASTAWYANAVRWANRSGMMSGYGGNLFGPEDPVTREQLASVFWRWAGSPAGQGEAYADNKEISDYARAAASWARSSGLMSGVGYNRFSPKTYATRGQLAVILMKHAGLSRVDTVNAIDIMCQPYGIAAMADGSLLVTDGYNKVIWRVADGKSTLFAGSDTVEDLFGQPIGGYYDAALLESIFKKPWAIVSFLGGWAISDPDNHVVRFLRPASDTGDYTRVTDLGVKFDHPTGLAVDGEGNLYVSETFQGKILKITPKGKVTTLASGLAEPMGLCWADGSLYAAECGGNRILKISGGGSVSVVAGSGQEGSADGSAAQATFSGPKGVAVDGDGAVYVADTDNGAVRRVRDGGVTTIFSRDPFDTTMLYPVAPTSLLIQGHTLYVGDVFARKLIALPLQ